MSSLVLIDDSLKDVMCLLVMYPMDSLLLNPWEVAQLFFKYKKSQKYREHLTQAEDLPALFQLFSVTFGVRTEMLARYFASFFATDSTGRSMMHDKVTTALSSPVLHFFLSYNCVKIMASNSDLIKWEFIRCFSHQKADSPFLEDLVYPLPCQRDFSVFEKCFKENESAQQCAFVLTEASALRWAMEVSVLSHARASALFQEACALTSGKSCVLTFSAFVVFSLLCFHSRSVDGSADARLNSSTDAEVAVRLFLEALSTRLTKVQQNMKLKILSPLLRRDQVKAGLLGEADRDSLFATSITLFERGASSKCSDKWKFLPPRPPPIFWDAPRIVDILRFMGVVERTGSLTTSWIAYGSHLAQSRGSSSGWGAYVVPPTPIKLEVGAVADILSNVCQMCCEEDAIWIAAKETTGDDRKALEELFGSYLCDTILPLVASYVEKGFLSSLNDDYQLRMEDLLRFGGAKAMRSLFDVGIWLEESYENLFVAGHGDLPPVLRQGEPDLTLVVKFFSCFGLIKPKDVAFQAKRALHARVRVLSCASGLKSDWSAGAATLSFPEFEELFLRSALSVWAECGAFRAHDDYFGDDDLEDSEPSAILQFYLDECELIGKIPSADMTGKTWGVDFVAGYANTLQYLMNTGAKHVEEGFGAFASLPAFLGLKKDVFLLFQRSGELPSESRVDTSTTLDMAVSQSPVNLAPPLSTLKDILGSNAVQSKAGALLKDILGSRNSSPRVADEVDLFDAFLDESALEDADSSTLSVASPTQSLLMGTKEALWPVYGTYCSCGDSVDPGKLSGPNLFALLSKLGVLTDQTLLSDIGILLHQISAHTHSSSVSIASATSSETFESPSLSFEEFLVFLCAFAQLRFDGKVSAPILSGKNCSEQLSGASSQNTEVWFQNWKTFMGNNQAFRRLMEGMVLPMLRRHPLLAYPQDARHRDKYSPVFSLEVLLAVEGSEEQLTEVFNSHVFSDGMCCDVNSAVTILEGIGLMPSVVSSDDVIQLFRDVAPEGRLSRSSSPSILKSIGLEAKDFTSGNDRASTNAMNFPQFEWVVCVVAFEAVERAISDCPVPTPQSKISKLVRDFIGSLAKSAHTVMLKNNDDL